MTKVYSEDASGSTVELKVKDNFNISLPETTMGGYRWRLVESGVPVLKVRNSKGTLLIHRFPEGAAAEAGVSPLNSSVQPSFDCNICVRGKLIRPAENFSST
jgi:hypothetical protein